MVVERKSVFLRCVTPGKSAMFQRMEEWETDIYDQTTLYSCAHPQRINKHIILKPFP